MKNKAWNEWKIDWLESLRASAFYLSLSSFHSGPAISLSFRLHLGFYWVCIFQKHTISHHCPSEGTMSLSQTLQKWLSLSILRIHKPIKQMACFISVCLWSSHQCVIVPICFLLILFILFLLLYSYFLNIFHLFATNFPIVGLNFSYLIKSVTGQIT